MPVKLGNAKLTHADVAGLRARKERNPQGFSARMEARRFGVGLETIRRALRGDTFGEVGETGEGIAPPSLLYEPAPGEIAASQEKLFRLLDDSRKGSADSLLAELEATRPELAEKARAFGAARPTTLIPEGLAAPPPEEERIGNPLDED